MVILNQENEKKELEKLNEPCPNELCFSYAQKPNNYNDLNNWNWMYRIHDKVYSFMDIKQFSVIKNKRIPFVIQKTNSTEMFEICFSEIPSEIDKIEVALEYVSYNGIPMSEIHEFIIRMFNINDEDNITLWNEFGFKNVRFTK